MYVATWMFGLIGGTHTHTAVVFACLCCSAVAAERGEDAHKSRLEFKILVLRAQLELPKRLSH